MTTLPVSTPSVISSDHVVLRAAVSAYLGRYRGDSRLHMSTSAEPEPVSDSCPVRCRHLGAMFPVDMSARSGHGQRGRHDPEPSFRREGAANLPGRITSSRNLRGPVSQGDRPRPELMAIHELELDALAQTGEQRRPVSGKDRLHKELVLVDQSQIYQRQG
jgi:hypothetical protein